MYIQAYHIVLIMSRYYRDGGQNDQLLQEMRNRCQCNVVLGIFTESCV
jgi:hypothetical protein